MLANKKAAEAFITGEGNIFEIVCEESSFLAVVSNFLF